jgi:hypothetical protein
MPKVDEHCDQFDDRNLFLQVLLGLVSGSRTLEELLVAYGPATAVAPEQRDTPCDTFLDVVVGLVAVSRQLAMELEAVAPPAADTAPEPVAPPRLSLRRYLA